jgi:hypothetical protein
VIQHQWVGIPKIKISTTWFGLIIIDSADLAARMLMIAHVSASIIDVEPAFTESCGISAAKVL